MVILLILTVGTAASLVLYALNQNIQLYFTPTQLADHAKLKGRIFRLGGMVVKGSIQRVPNSLIIHFDLTDYAQTIAVEYEGMLPALFREGQGIVAEGKLNAKGTFVANQVLAKHDEKYKPPSIALSPPLNRKINAS